VISLLFVVMTVMVPAFLSWRIVKGPAQFPTFVSMIVAGVCFLVILAGVSAAIPFTLGGDDLAYFRASEREFKTFGDWFDMRQFSQTHEQGGYPLILTWIHQFAAGSVFVRKTLNVLLFLLLSVVWCDIGRIVGGPRVAINFCRGVLLCTPLWYYWMFILKDMAIVLLQSLAILGVVCVTSRREQKKGYALVVAGTVLIMPFRSMLALANVAFVAVSSLLTTGGRGASKARVIQISVYGLIVLGVLYIGTRPDILASLGVNDELRAMNASSFEKAASLGNLARAKYFYNPLMFVMVFLVGEVNAFNPRSWGGEAAPMLRAVLMAPWIYVGLPLFLWSGLQFLKGSKDAATFVMDRSQPVSSKISRAYLSILFGFVVMYAVIAWLSGDTTRWRMPSLPPMAAIAVLGWLSMRKKARTKLLLVWGCAVSGFIIVYYSIFK
jgi:hypothetical protein